MTAERRVRVERIVGSETRSRLLGIPLPFLVTYEWEAYRPEARHNNILVGRYRFKKSAQKAAQKAFEENT